MEEVIVQRVEKLPFELQGGLEKLKQLNLAVFAVDAQFLYVK